MSQNTVIWIPEPKLNQFPQLLEINFNKDYSPRSFPLILSFLILSSFVTPNIRSTIFISTNPTYIPVPSSMPMSLPHPSVPVLPLSWTPSHWSSHSFPCLTTLQTLSTSSSIHTALCGWRLHPVLHLSTKVVNVFTFFKSLPVNGSLRLVARCTQVGLFSIISTDLQSSLFHCSSQFIKLSLSLYMLSSSRLPSTIISSANSIHQWSCYLM